MYHTSPPTTSTGGSFSFYANWQDMQKTGEASIIQYNFQLIRTEFTEKQKSLVPFLPFLTVQSNKSCLLLNNTFLFLSHFKFCFLLFVFVYYSSAAPGGIRFRIYGTFKPFVVHHTHITTCHVCIVILHYTHTSPHTMYVLLFYTTHTYHHMPCM